MSTTNRQNNLLLNQDWKRIYQTFKSADFKSYDFENLRRVIISYLRENYPEDFNDYVESSEYVALIDAMAFIGQSLAFRIDLASRENFIDLAETKESVLRLARLLSYQPKRNIPASGLLKFDTITTTENIIDSNGKNLAGQVIIWNDPTNPSWFEQFILILNSAMSDGIEFGKSQGTATINGVKTDQYRFKSRFSGVPSYRFDKSISNQRMQFEIVSTTFKDSQEFYEEPPVPGNRLGFVYRNDGKGNMSPHSGFFLMVKQGSLEQSDFSIEVPTTNEVVSVDRTGINDTDVWLFSLNQQGVQSELWKKVPSLIGNNIVYNSLSSKERNIYNVVSRDEDRVDLVFADGVYGNLPKGMFRAYYRTSNGQNYVVNPSEMRSVTISVPYMSKTGNAAELTISLSLKQSITNASASEDIASIKMRAPAIYYTQNRMITGEDYNLAPLSSSQDIIKVKAINRTSSGISRNFDIVDASGKYSSVTVFADDGYIYKENQEDVFSLKYNNKLDIVNFIRRTIEPVVGSSSVFNFFLTNYNQIVFGELGITWRTVFSDTNLCTGYFLDQYNGFQRVGNYTPTPLKYLKPSSLIKFVPPEGKRFKNGKIVDTDPFDPDQTAALWTKAVRVVGDGTNGNKGALPNGVGPISFNDEIPTGAIAAAVVPVFTTNLPSSLETEIVNLVTTGLDFGIRYDIETTSWKVITSSNLDPVSPFKLGQSGDVSNTNSDSSWIICFVREPDRYSVRIRKLAYVFGSLQQNRFYYDSNQKVYDSRTGKVIKDRIKILGINTDHTRISPLQHDVTFSVSDAIKFDDGYQSSSEVEVTFDDSDSDGVIDNPDSFLQIVGNDDQHRFIFFKKTTDFDGNFKFEWVNNPGNTVIKIEPSQLTASINEYTHGQLVYFYSATEDRVMRVDRFTNTFSLEPDYKAVIGRTGIKFQYVHSANVDRRIDPSMTNIVDLYLLTKSYDRAFRNFVSGNGPMPTPPSSDQLKTMYGKSLDAIKAMSDEVIYYPAKYKVLFGSTAVPKLQSQFLVVKNSSKPVNDNELKVKIISAINLFFEVQNWDFGDRFHLGELIAFVTNQVAPDISNLVIVPRQPDMPFGSLFEVQSNPDEIFISGATVDDIKIVPYITSAEIRAPASTFVNSTK